MEKGKSLLLVKKFKWQEYISSDPKFIFYACNYFPRIPNIIVTTVLRRPCSFQTPNIKTDWLYLLFL